MKRKNNFLKLLLIVTLLLTAIFIFPSFVFSAKDTELGRKAVETFGKKIRKEKGWILAGSGGSFCNPDEIVINLWFDTIDRAKLAEGRKTIIETSEKLVNFINKNEKYKKIFKNNSFSIKNLDLTIQFNYDNTKAEETEYLLSASIIKGKILYFYLIGEKVFSKRDEDETYEQARAIVIQEKSETQKIQSSLGDRKNMND